MVTKKFSGHSVLIYPALNNNINDIWLLMNDGKNNIREVIYVANHKSRNGRLKYM